jgi:hypothetical protein
MYKIQIFLYNSRTMGYSFTIEQIERASAQRIFVETYGSQELFLSASSVEINDRPKEYWDMLANSVVIYLENLAKPKLTEMLNNNALLAGNGGHEAAKSMLPLIAGKQTLNSN